VSLALTLRRAARRDIAQTARWYQARSPQTAQQFFHAAYEAARRVARHPQGPAILIRDIRRVAVDDFPYHLYYRVTPMHIIVVAVLHRRRNPVIWQGRY
jgi:plasmid stabilization system protein ParE